MPLTPPKGPFPVSTVTLEMPARAPRSFGASQFLRKTPSGATVDAFQLKTVLVTLFYPAATREGGSNSKASTSGQHWLGSSRLRAIEGLLKYAGVSRYLAYPAVFLLPFNTRLAVPSLQRLASSSASTSAFPVAVFSHGLAGTQTTYSSYLAELASHGMVIASVEHRDLSSPYTSVQTRNESGKLEIDELVYTKYEELDVRDSANGGDKPDLWAMRTAQLELRQAEVLEAVNVLTDINDGKAEALIESNTRTLSPADRESLRLEEWSGRLDLNGGLWALGHSYGGATCIELLRRSDAPFTRAVVLDPWLEPIKKAGEGGLPLRRPLYVVNSEAFTIWRSHFKQLRSLVKESADNTGTGWLISIAKTKHTDFSDLPFVLPRFFKPKPGGRTPLEILHVFASASRMAFQGTFDRDGLGMPVRDERAGEVEARDLGNGGEVIWHPLDGRIASESAATDEAARL